jgi:arylsulfatase
MADEKPRHRGKQIGNTINESTPSWPDRTTRPDGAPNILLILFDDVGFSDFGCYGSGIDTPNIDRVAGNGLRYTGFHTTAMCSTTRASLLTGRNHHAVGVGSLANFDSGFPGYRGKISPQAGTLAEMLRGGGWRNYMVGKWHVTPLIQTGPTGPYDGWPLGRGFDRFYGFLDAETDQYSPELVRDNSRIDAPGTFETGYHLTEDLVDQSINFLADHLAEPTDCPWLMWVAFGACHAPHQAPQDLILKYDERFSDGWDAERERRLARQKEMGIAPASTKLPPRNDHVKPWKDHSTDEQRVFTRLQAAYAAMLEHADTQIGRLLDFLQTADLTDDTIVLILSDNGASQEGGPNGLINAMGPYNLKPEDMAEKISRIDDIGGPDTHSNFPWGWAMAANTPLKRYKQNTHGGGVRDPLIISWPKQISANNELRNGFWHVQDITPTLLELCSITPPTVINGVEQTAITGQSLSRTFEQQPELSRSDPQYFEMFGHRGIWRNGFKAVAYHPLGKSFDDDQWELYDLTKDFAENDDLAQTQPETLATLKETWWQQARDNQVLPLDDRFGPRFAENALRHQQGRRNYVFHAGMGHLPSDVCPDVRSCNYTIEAEVSVTSAQANGVIIAHGDATSGYSLYLQDGFLVHDINVGGKHQIIRSEKRVTPGKRLLGYAMKVGAMHRTEPLGSMGRVTKPTSRHGSLFIDRELVGQAAQPFGFITLISWSGLDIGRDRGSPVSEYHSPFELTEQLFAVRMVLEAPDQLDGDAIGHAEMSRE